MNHLLYLLLKKTQLNKCIYRLLKKYKHAVVIKVNSEEIEQTRKLLNTLHDDPRSSCIYNNLISSKPQYDLLIIVPAYNAEKYIEECLNSIFSQNTRYTYIVKVVDDGSTDRTPVILQNYKGRKEIEIISQSNKGFSGARNTGLKEINARYVMFIDSDDKLAPDAINVLMNKADETESDIIEGSFLKFYDRWVTHRYWHINNNEVPANKLYGFAWGKIYKACLFSHIHFPEGYWFEDTVCSLILHPMAKKRATVHQCVYCYRTNFSGISRTFRGKMKCLDSFYISEQLLADRKKLGLPLDQNFLHSIVRQFLLNSNRIFSLKRKDINKAIFIQQMNLIQKFFPSISISDEYLHPLINGNYTLYKLQATLL